MKYLSTIYSGSAREQELGPCRALQDPSESSVAFNTKEPTLKKVEEVVSAARTKSAPGPGGLAYAIYKRFFRLLIHLWQIIKVIWRRGKSNGRLQKVPGC